MIRTTVGTLRRAVRVALLEADMGGLERSFPRMANDMRGPGTRDRPDYQFYVVSRGGTLIESGWADEMEAESASWKLMRAHIPNMLFSRQEMAREGLNPANDAHWH